MQDEEKTEAATSSAGEAQAPGAEGAAGASEYTTQSEYEVVHHPLVFGI